MIHKKATNLENAEYNMWRIQFDWTNQVMPEDFSISYNRQFNKRAAVEHEIGEVLDNGVFSKIAKAKEYP